jgi:hypothetical protein
MNGCIEDYRITLEVYVRLDWVMDVSLQNIDLSSSYRINNGRAGINQVPSEIT